MTRYEPPENPAIKQITAGMAPAPGPERPPHERPAPAGGTQLAWATDVRIVDRAVVPSSHFRPSLKRSLASALMLLDLTGKPAPRSPKSIIGFTLLAIAVGAALVMFYEMLSS